MSKPFHGSCLCGEVNFEVNADPIVVSTCHCTNCKKFTGTVFTTNVVFPAGSTTVTKGQSHIGTYHDTSQDSGNPLMRIFCTRCSSPLYNLGGDFGRTLSVFYSALDDFHPEIVADGHSTNVPKSDGDIKDTEIKGDSGEEKWKKAVVPEVEYYVKDRVGWIGPVQGAEQARTKPGR